MTEEQKNVEAVSLKACPLCGASADGFHISLSQSYGYAEPGNPDAGLTEKGFYVECDQCGCCGPNEETKAAASDKWNTRATLSDQEARDELSKIAEQVGEPDDPYAAWEAIDAIIRERDRFRKALYDVAKCTGGSHAVAIAHDALTRTEGSRT